MNHARHRAARRAGRDSRSPERAGPATRRIPLLDRASRAMEYDVHLGAQALSSAGSVLAALVFWWT
ncbi:hypothetical protein [Rhodococcus rhodnii]|uniref:Uncharacterized protein n=1 Tax=Rhodococcus rhodnii LMG 5362 TaxID=1273125 RepID=R7WUN7_9NOCA|nr:hypothetical protein [Rhodococcus rhodnii]EOM77839.1 hypothetical protein Rrhod_0825 [Rhodococcus rhodnii LMG 5362]